MSALPTRVIGEEQVLSLLRAHRGRAELFGPGLFENCAWEILLELFAAELGRRRLTLDDLASVGPKSVIARWIAYFRERRLIECEIGQLDPKQFRIRLTRDCAGKIALVLSCVLQREGFG